MKKVSVSLSFYINLSLIWPFNCFMQWFNHILVSKSAKEMKQLSCHWQNLRYQTKKHKTMTANLTLCLSHLWSDMIMNTLMSVNNSHTFLRLNAATVKRILNTLKFNSAACASQFFFFICVSFLTKQHWNFTGLFGSLFC